MINFTIAVLLLFISSVINAHSNTPENQNSDKELISLIDKIPPPPKNINDVIKLLDNSKSDLQTLEKYKQLVKSNPDPNLNKVQLWEYIRDKFSALENLGYTKELEENCLMGLEATKDLTAENYLDAQTNCVISHGTVGDRKKVAERIELMLKNPDVQNSAGWQLTYLNLKLQNLGILGDLKSAQEVVIDVDRLINKMKGFRNGWTEMGLHWTYQAELAKGTFFMIEGKPVEAELSYARSLKALDIRLQYNQTVGQDLNRRINKKEVVSTWKAGVLLELGRSLQAQKKLIEAEYYYREALKLYLGVGGKTSIRVARSLNLLSNCVNDQGRFEEGTALLQYALKIYTDVGISEKAANFIGAKKAYASSLVNIEKYTEALTQFSALQSTIDSDDFLKKNIGKLKDLDEVIALIFTKNFEKAEVVAQSIFDYQKNTVGPNHPRTILAQAFYAMTLIEQKKIKEAKDNFLFAMPLLIEQVRNDSETSNISQKAQRRFAMIVESYVGLLFQEAKADKNLEKNLVSEAFLLADLARGSSVQKALSQSTARSFKDKKLAELARTEQDLQRKINSLNELLLNLSQASSSSSTQEKIKNDISSLRSERNSVKKDIESRYPEYFDLVEPKPITIERTAKILNANEVLVTWYFGERQSFVWAINQNGLSNFSNINVTKKDISRDVKNLRKSLDPGVASVEEIPAFDVVLSNKLYTQIIKPIEQSFIGKNLLISVPHESLGQLPISVLLTEKINQPAKGAAALKDYQNAPWLIRRIAISQLPSVNALASLRGVKIDRNEIQSFIAFADPYFSKAQATSAAKVETAQAINTRGKPLNLRSAPKTSKVSSAELALLPSLPDTNIEVNEIGKVLNAKPEDIFLNQHASVKKVLETDFSKKNIIMFSTHGLVPGELNGLTQPALALSSPDVTGEKDSDGLLTMDKILELKLNADWVVLSACNTASSDHSSEAVSGLGRAFFYAGARALLVSNWPVDTVSSRELMVDLFKRQNNQEKITKPEALRQAMLGVADKGAARIGNTNVVSYFYSHPLFWAPFVMVGD